MILSAPQIPKHARIELYDPPLKFATVDRIHFHGGVADVNHGVLRANADTRIGVEPLTRHEETIMALSAVGLSYVEIGEALFKDTETVRSQSQQMYRKLGATGAHAKIVAIGRAFETGFFSVHRSIEPCETALRYANIVRHRATGEPATMFRDERDGSRTGRKRGLETLTNLVGLEDGNQVQALVFYGHLTGIVQAEPYVPYEPCKPKPEVEAARASIVRIGQAQPMSEIHLSA